MADWGSNSIQKQLFQRCAPPIIEGARSQGRNEAEGTPERGTDKLLRSPAAALGLFSAWVGWGDKVHSSSVCPSEEGPPLPHPPTLTPSQSTRLWTGTPRATDGLVS